MANFENKSNSPGQGGDNPLGEKEHDIEVPAITLAEMSVGAKDKKQWTQMARAPKANLYDLIGNMGRSRILTDVQVIVGSETFDCHSMVLQCYSEMFNQLGTQNVIKLSEENISPLTFKRVYDWMMDNVMLNRDDIMELYNAGYFLQIKELIKWCWECIEKDETICEDIAFLMYFKARKYQTKNIDHLILTRIQKFFLTLVASKEFLELNAAEICSLFNSTMIGVNSEIEVFFSAVRWLNHKWNERQRYVGIVMKCVRFSIMLPWDVAKLSLSHGCANGKHIIEHPEVKHMMIEGLSNSTINNTRYVTNEQFLEALQTVRSTMPSERRWIYDEMCSYHKNETCGTDDISYELFHDYLEFLQSAGKNHWKSLKNFTKEY